MDNNEPDKKDYNKNSDKRGPGQDNKGPLKFNFGNNRFALFFLISLIIMFLVMFVFNDNSSATEISYTSFMNYIDENKIESIKIFDNQEIQGNMKNGSGRVMPFKTRIPYYDDNLLILLEEKGIKVNRCSQKCFNLQNPDRSYSLDTYICIYLVYAQADAGRRK